MLRLFEERVGEWIPLNRILQLGVAQYNARIRELRGEGYVIENKIEWVERRKHSWFRFRGRAKEGDLV